VEFNNNMGGQYYNLGPYFGNSYRFDKENDHKEFVQWINDNEWTEVDNHGNRSKTPLKTATFLAWISPRNLPSPFNYSTQNIHEILMYLLWRGERESQIFYREPGKPGTIKSRRALEYLQKIVPNLMVEYKSREEIEREERERRERIERERREREERERREREAREERERREREERARQIQQQKNQAIAAVEEHWNKNKDNNGKINNQTIGELLGSNWKDSFNLLTTSEQVKREQEKLTATISKAKEEANKEVCNIVGHQKIKEEFDRLKSANLTDYTSLTQKSAEQKTNDKGTKYTNVTFHENFSTQQGEKSWLAVYDYESQELKDWVIKQKKVWVLTKYLTEAWHIRAINKEDLVNPSSLLFTYLNNLWELEQVKKDKVAAEQEKDNLKKNNQELQKQLQAAMNELMGVYQVEEQTQAVQVQGNLPLPGGNK
jgi:hypothetical protein